MHIRALSILAVSACSILAAPSAASPSFYTLKARTRTCANAPNTKAGTLFHPRTPTPFDLLPRPNGILDDLGELWCATGTQTYINVVMRSVIPAEPLQRLLGEVFTAVLNHLQAHGDGLVPAGVFSYYGPAVDGHVGCALHVWNTNNHQISWGVLGAGLRALGEYMYANARYGEADFRVYDGPDEVALGVIG